MDITTLENMNLWASILLKGIASIFILAFILQVAEWKNSDKD